MALNKILYWKYIEPKDKKDKDNIPKSLKSLFDPDSVDESYQGLSFFLILNSLKFLKKDDYFFFQYI